MLIASFRRQGECLCELERYAESRDVLNRCIEIMRIHGVEEGSDQYILT